MGRILIVLNVLAAENIGFGALLSDDSSLSKTLGMFFDTSCAGSVLFSTRANHHSLTPWLAHPDVVLVCSECVYNQIEKNKPKFFENYRSIYYSIE
jgi:hypothetical protein